MNFGTIFWLIIIVVAVLLVGTWPLSILSKVFEYIGVALDWLAKGLNFFGWNGLLR